MQELTVTNLTIKPCTVFHPHLRHRVTKARKMLLQLTLGNQAGARMRPVRPKRTRYIRGTITSVNQFQQPTIICRACILCNKNQKITPCQRCKLISCFTMTKILRENGFHTHATSARLLNRIINRPRIYNYDLKIPGCFLR